MAAIIEWQFNDELVFKPIYISSRMSAIVNDTSQSENKNNNLK